MLGPKIIYLAIAAGVGFVALVWPGHDSSSDRSDLLKLLPDQILVAMQERPGLAENPEKKIDGAHPLEMPAELRIGMRYIFHPVNGARVLSWREILGRAQHLGFQILRAPASEGELLRNYQGDALFRVDVALKSGTTLSLFNEPARLHAKSESGEETRRLADDLVAVLSH